MPRGVGAHKGSALKGGGPKCRVCPWSSRGLVLGGLKDIDHLFWASWVIV